MYFDGTQAWPLVPDARHHCCAHSRRRQQHRQAAYKAGDAHQASVKGADGTQEAQLCDLSEPGLPGSSSGTYCVTDTAAGAQPGLRSTATDTSTDDSSLQASSAAAPMHLRLGVDVTLEEGVAGSPDLGGGAFGRVVEGWYSGRPVAVKLLHEYYVQSPGVSSVGSKA